ncbi:unnamed protein product [Sympodiomycopsis kandeliae]
MAPPSAPGSGGSGGGGGGSGSTNGESTSNTSASTSNSTKPLPSATSHPPKAPTSKTTAAAQDDPHSQRPSSPGVATGPPWTHPPNPHQFPPPPPPPSAAAVAHSSAFTNARSSHSPHPPSSSASSKNKTGKAPQTIADAVAASVGNKKERKRKRIHYSCAECHRRKHKCDRSFPCGPCLERGIGDTCRPFENGDEHGDYRDRISRLEDIVEALATAQTSLAKELTEARAAGGFRPGSATAAQAQIDVNAARRQVANGRPGGKNNGQDDDDDDDYDPYRPSSKRLRPPSVRGLEREELFHAERRTEGIDEDEDGKRVPGHSILEGGGNPLEGGLTTEGDAFFGALALPSVSRGAVETEINGERLELGAHLPRFPASFKVARLVSEGGASPTIVQELMDLLPPKNVTDELLELYFRDINHTRLPIHEGTFRQSYIALMSFKWGRAREEVGDDGARHIPFLAFLFIMLATAKRNEPESKCTEEEAKKGAMKLYHACRKALHVASFIRADHIDLVLAQCFAARFLITCRQSAESWSMLGSAIRAAQAIGLHRDGSKLGLDAATTERRRRLWSLLFYQDKSTSILLGRPPAIQNHHCDTMAPSDVDVDTMPRTAVAGPPRWAAPGTPPGVFNFVAIRHELTILTGKIAEHFQNLSAPRSYSDVVKIDEELEAFRAHLPSPYRCEEGTETDRSFDEVCPHLPLHRYLISVEYHYVRCTLHRPYLLRNSEKYALSRNAAFASARADRRCRKEYRKDVQWPKDRARKRHMGGLYRLFSSTLITGIELLLDPTGPDAPELLACLDDFVEKHNRRAEKDQCSKREVAIIELFRAKAKDPSWCARKGAKKLNLATTGQVPGGGAGGSVDGNAPPGIPAGRSAGPLAPVADSPTGMHSMNNGGASAPSLHAMRPTLGGRTTSMASGTGTGTPPGFGFNMANVPSTPGNFNQQELAQSIFDTLGGGLDQFGLSSALQSNGKGSSSGNGFGAIFAQTQGSDTGFGGLAASGPTLSLPDEMSSSFASSEYPNFWESDARYSGVSGGQSSSAALTPTMSSQGNPSSVLPWANSAHMTSTGGAQTTSSPAGSSGSGSGSGTNLASMDWSADSLMPWGAMIEAITMQKPGQQQQQQGQQGGGGSGTPTGTGSGTPNAPR